jgi:hypothetical protein
VTGRAFVLDAQSLTHASEDPSLQAASRIALADWFSTHEDPSTTESNTWIGFDDQSDCE